MKKNKHSKIINELVNRLYYSYISYNFINVEEEYDMFNGRHGECDIYAKYKDNLLLFEVKSRDTHKNRQKAYNQLQKDKLYYNSIYKPRKIYEFYVYGIKKGYIIERVRLK